MNVRNLKLTVLFFACLTVNASVAQPVSQKPNVILIMVDDMGYSDLGFMGSEIKTPNLDKLASKSLVMT